MSEWEQEQKIDAQRSGGDVRRGLQALTTAAGASGCHRCGQAFTDTNIPVILGTRTNYEPVCALCAEADALKHRRARLAGTPSPNADRRAQLDQAERQLHNT